MTSYSSYYLVLIAVEEMVVQGTKLHFLSSEESWL
jgi:hypothetical protein